MGFRRVLGALSLNGFGRRTKVALNRALFFLLQSFAENVFIFGVRLGEVGQAKPLGRLQFSAAFRITLHKKLEAPFDFSGRAFPASTKELVVFDLQLTDVSFDLAQIFVNGGHRGTMPRLSMLVPLIRPVNDSAFALSKLYNWLQGGVTCTEGQAFN